MESTLRSPVFVVFAWLATVAAGGELAPPTPPGVALEQLPLYFEIPDGASSRYLARGAGYAVHLTPDRVVLTVLPEKGRAVARIGIELVGASDTAAGAGLEPVAGPIHDLRGARPGRWRENLVGYRRLRFSDVYPGVDVDYHGRGGHLEYDFTLAPGVAAESVRLRFSGVASRQVSEDGTLVLQAAGVTLRQPRPRAFQLEGAAQREVDASFALHPDGEVGFEVGEYDPTRPLVIDPVIVYSELLGGSGSDAAQDVAVDAAGVVYVVGSTLSEDFPIENASQPEIAGHRDVFVMKFDPAHGALRYVSFLGGAEDDTGYAIDVDDAGRAWVAGATRSPDFPVVSALQASLGGSGDAFLTELDPDGLPIFSTYLGGDGMDAALDVAVDPAGRAHLTGSTRSTDLFAPGAFQAALAGSADAFVMTVAPHGDRIEYASYLGGSGFDQGLGLALDGDGGVYLTGETRSADFPIRAALQGAGGASDAFLARVDADGAMSFSSYLGGSGMDRGEAVAASGGGVAYVTGTTRSADFPLRNPLQTEIGGGFDAFVTGVDVRAGQMVFSTFLGGEGSDLGLDAASRDGSVYLAGQTSSFDFFGMPAEEPAPGGGMDAFLVRLDADGANLLYAGAFGGTGNEAANALGVDPGGQVHLVGRTSSTDFLRLGLASTGGGGDAFLLGPELRRADLEVLVTKARGSGVDLAVDNTGPDAAQRVELLVLSDALGAVPDPDQGSCWAREGVAVCDLGTLPVGARVGVRISGKLKLDGGIARVSALTVDPELLDNTVALDAASGRSVFLRVKRVGNGAGEVSSLSGDIRCGDDCLGSYRGESRVRLTAQAAPGSRFVGWRAACSGTSECVLDVNGPTTVVALFERQRGGSPAPAPAEPAPPPEEPGRGKGGRR